MQKSFITFICTFLALCMGPLAFANNLVISAVTLTNDSTLSFSVSWENSWRVGVAPNNHDAVWLFIKKRDCASLQWSHVNLSNSSSNHSAASPLEIYIDGKDGGSVAKGVFVRRSAIGVGNISSVAVSLRMTGLVVGQYDFQVFGIEMVQIPQGAFQLGDGASSTNSFKAGASSLPFDVLSEAAITAGTAATTQLSASTLLPISLPAEFPKGFNEIYCMKYEISQGQYSDFTNALNSDQATARQVVSVANRLNISGTWPTVLAAAPHRAMAFLAWADLAAYLDWAALRPMTELEFEKIARGPAIAVADEYAWGSSIITDGNTLVNDGTATEGVSNAITAGGGIANFNNSTVLGPVRCGFAAKAGTNRQQAGAGYYGVMELSGNVYEQTVCTRNATGVAFQAILGDGEISPTPTPGFANVATWPSPTASVASATSAVGRGLRGGAWSTATTELNTSSRSSIDNATGQRLNSIGGRGVR